MSFFINAWLERNDPKIELWESSTNRIIFHVEGELLISLLKNGEVDISDLQKHENTHSLINELLLKSVTEGYVRREEPRTSTTVTASHS